MDDSYRTASHIADKVFSAVRALGQFHNSLGRDLTAAGLTVFGVAMPIGNAVMNKHWGHGLDIRV